MAICIHAPILDVTEHDVRRSAAPLGCERATVTAPLRALGAQALFARPCASRVAPELS
jgi:hypothetical protein